MNGGKTSVGSPSQAQKHRCVFGIQPVINATGFVLND
jgi:hypothetical protein